LHRRLFNFMKETNNGKIQANEIIESYLRRLVMKSYSGSEIRDMFIKFFESKGHKYVPSASLVPGGDATLLFTNAGMVQFKDVFLGTDERPYVRAANSQKCMRVAGKHNDLDEVGRDDSHHTFFEMLGNWSFGDYYKQEAISWAWELLTEVWGLDKSRLWTTYFKDEQGQIEMDAEAAGIWAKQPGMVKSQILPFGRKENFWEMAEVGPCGPCSEIHYDLGPDACNKKGVAGHVCSVNGDCSRYMEIWNLVFIQYNRMDAKTLNPLPKKHVDTGMGFERIVSILQSKKSNYLTDLLYPAIQAVQAMTGDTDEAVMANFTPYRVIADHVRATAFLIADGVVPGNMGRNYICRMIIRRASRFGRKLGLNEPFMAKVAESFIAGYGQAYPEMLKNRETILDNLTQEEIRFHKTLDSA
jgi:alanyl-tRNA synthetase